ncbi:hypothetical protein OV203_37080 [Nannocystis sp. ILAH1]|uniref:hypothetical protein n=1 Tax=Nannocystis sp. ILAH1 TaxID=2996789 RepID=UPI00227209CA|nr:hypothetical protein [Nannocystis sp. ILAH1]MCY0992814.1 hypothetical protein [Nannocystis sp. ILAH1]
MSRSACHHRRAREPEWRPVPGATRYDASDTGLVRKAATGRILAQTASGRNSGRLWHLSCSIVDDDGLRRNRWVSHLILLTFVGPAPAGAHACHRSDDPTLNTIDELYWGWPSHNAADRRRNGGADPSRAGEIERQRQDAYANLCAKIYSMNAELVERQRRRPDIEAELAAFGGSGPARPNAATPRAP